MWKTMEKCFNVAKTCNFTKSKLLHGRFSCFLNYANGTKSRKESHMISGDSPYCRHTNSKVNKNTFFTEHLWWPLLTIITGKSSLVHTEILFSGIVVSRCKLVFQFLLCQVDFKQEIKKTYLELGWTSTKEFFAKTINSF